MGCAAPQRTRTGSTLVISWRTLVSSSGSTGQSSAGTHGRGGRGPSYADDAGVLVSIQAPPQLRDRILGAVREVAPASAGCPATHPISADPAWRPTAAIPVGHLSDVTEVVACKYPLPIGDEATALKSSVTLIGEPAADAMARHRRQRRRRWARRSGGMRGEFRLRRRGDRAARRVRAGSERDRLALLGLRVHHGFDDGADLRTLSVSSVAPFIIDANTVMSGHGGAMTQILFGDRFSGPTPRSELRVTTTRVNDHQVGSRRRRGNLVVEGRTRQPH
ncbi:hypothetical protein BH24ACT12_BH24ACT12_26650 [soil metagenome]